MEWEIFQKDRIGTIESPVFYFEKFKKARLAHKARQSRGLSSSGVRSGETT